MTRAGFHGVKEAEFLCSEGIYRQIMEKELVYVFNDKKGGGHPFRLGC